MNTEQHIVKFYSKSSIAKCLSNFSELKVIINDKHYKTGEHAFHGLKYLLIAGNIKDDDRIKKLIDYSLKFEGDNPYFKTPIDAKIGGGKRGLLLEKSELEFWNIASKKVQKKICNYKFKSYPEVQDIIKKYKDSYLLHQDNRANKDTIWGGRINKETNELIGNNKLGLLWMRIQKT
jgi:predicted NAD-dependent protein-ADP-ribosyltransferase YbiA (DUF1768 family)